jgi:hypothetical protein
MSLEMNPVVDLVADAEPVGVIDFNVMFPGLENHAIRYVFRVCGLRDLPSQRRLMSLRALMKLMIWQTTRTLRLTRWPSVPRSVPRCVACTVWIEEDKKVSEGSLPLGPQERS